MARSSAVLLACLGCASAAVAATPVEVDPTVGMPETVFHVEVRAEFPIRQTRDRYWFILRGPGGRRCETTVANRVGITPPRRARRVFVDMPGVRVANGREVVPGPWCPGVFRGRVEFRDWRPRARRYVIRRMGTFSVEVRSES
jgi:hypothetical protein